MPLNATTNRTYSGIVHFAAESFGAALEGRVGGGTMAVDSRHPGCIENRWKFVDGCEYDGKVTSVLFRGKTLLYVRNNLNQFVGGRYIAMTSSSSPSGPFAPMQLIRIAGYADQRSHAKINHRSR